MTGYTKTGFPRGRPRFGESRPPSPNSIKWQNWRQKRIKSDPEYKEVLAKRQRDWVSRNKERNSRNRRQTYARRKLWIEHFTDMGAI